MAEEYQFTPRDFLEDERKEFQSFRHASKKDHEIMQRAGERISRKEVKHPSVLVEFDDWLSSPEVEEKEREIEAKLEKKKESGSPEEVDRFIYFSEDYLELMKNFGHDGTEELYGKKQIEGFDAVKMFKGIEDTIDRIKYLESLSTPDAIACLYSIDDNLTIKRVTNLKQRLEYYSNVINDQDSDYQPDSFDSLEHALKMDLLRYSMFGTPELEIYTRTRKKIEAETWANTKRLIPLSGGRAGVHSYEFLDKLYKDACTQAGKKGEMSEEAKKHLAIGLGVKWLKKSIDYHRNYTSPRSYFFGSYQEAVDWARLPEKTQQRLQFLRQNVSGIDLHNIRRFIGKSEPNKALEKKFFAARHRLHKFENDPDSERDRIINDFTSKEENKFSKKIEKIERDEAREARELWEKTDSKENAKSELEESAKHFKESKQRAKESHEKELERLKNLSVDEIKKLLQSKHDELERRKIFEEPISKKALDLEFLAHQYGSIYPTNIDWINTAPYGLINKCHRMLNSGMSYDKVMSYINVYEVMGEDFENLSGKQIRSLLELPPRMIEFIKENLKKMSPEDINKMVDDP
ncbi:hypothetical protein KKC60_03890, partial [Patescibacteria group bacterium]|nr:hypothetical protein [Patescibacteria group bacterium]